jgi:hypothetical protein
VGSINVKIKGPVGDLLTCIASREPSEWKSLLHGSIYSLPTLPGSGSADPGEGISCSRAGMMAAYSSTSCSGSGWIILQEIKIYRSSNFKSIIFIWFIPARRPLSCILYRYPTSKCNLGICRCGDKLHGAPGWETGLFVLPNGPFQHSISLEHSCTPLDL